jgi:hypothetical protein
MRTFAQAQFEHAQGYIYINMYVEYINLNRIGYSHMGCGHRCAQKVSNGLQVPSGQKVWRLSLDVNFKTISGEFSTSPGSPRFQSHWSALDVGLLKLPAQKNTAFPAALQKPLFLFWGY